MHNCPRVVRCTILSTTIQIVEYAAVLSTGIPQLKHHINPTCCFRNAKLSLGEVDIVASLSAVCLSVMFVHCGITVQSILDFRNACYGIFPVDAINLQEY